MVEHLADVGQRLALGDAGGSRIGDRHDVATQTMPGALERQPGAGTGFVEGADQDLAGQRPGDASAVVSRTGRPGGTAAAILLAG